MRILIFVLGVGLLFPLLGSISHGQGGPDKGKVEQPKDQPKTGDAKSAPTKSSRVSRPDPFVPYSVAVVGIIAILVLVCMPARRE